MVADTSLRYQCRWIHIYPWLCFSFPKSFKLFWSTRKTILLFLSGVASALWGPLCWLIGRRLPGPGCTSKPLRRPCCSCNYQQFEILDSIYFSEWLCFNMKMIFVKQAKKTLEIIEMGHKEVHKDIYLSVYCHNNARP